MVTTPLGRLFQRHAEQSVAEALADTRVVLVNGARQSGKSTLVRQFANTGVTEWRDLDDPPVEIRCNPLRVEHVVKGVEERA